MSPVDSFMPLLRAAEGPFFISCINLTSLNFETISGPLSLLLLFTIIISLSKGSASIIYFMHSSMYFSALYKGIIILILTIFNLH